MPRRVKKQTEELPRIYLSGGYTFSPEQEPDWIKKTGCQYRCYSYAYVRPGAFYYDKRMQEVMEIDIKHGLGIMMDSSGFSFHQFARSASGVRAAKKMKFDRIEELREVVVEDYIKFIKKRGKDFDFYVNFDYVQHCPTIYRTQKRIEEHGVRPLPIYHGDHGLEWIDRYLDEGHTYIGLGTGKMTRSGWDKQKRYYDLVFNHLEKRKQRIKVHGFAVTGFTAAFSWPWYSVDSSSWAKVGAYGQIIVPDPEELILKQIHVSDRGSGNKASYNRMEKSAQKQLEREVEELGFDFGPMRSEENARAIFNAYVYAHMHKWRPTQPIMPKFRRLV